MYRLFELDGDLAPVYTHEKNGVRVEAWYVGGTCVSCGRELCRFCIGCTRSFKPPKATKMDVNEFHSIYGHASETLLRTTAKRLGVELTGKMHACTGRSMAKAYRKGIAHETKCLSLIHI